MVIEGFQERQAKEVAALNAHAFDERLGYAYRYGLAVQDERDNYAMEKALRGTS